MIAKRFWIAAAVVLLALSNASCGHTSRTDSRASPGASASGVSGTGASGAAEMGRGRCEALTGAERDRCLVEDRGQRSDARK
jgi:hypothetical protein